jgi:hypothetical protein
VRRTEMTLDQTLERRRIAVLRPGDEIGVGRLRGRFGGLPGSHSFINARHAPAV